MLFRQVFLDCAQLAGIVMDMPEVDGARVGAIGGSQGGALTIACAALEPRIVRRRPDLPVPMRLQAHLGDGPGDCARTRRSGTISAPLTRATSAKTKSSLGWAMWTSRFLAPRIQAEVLMAVGLMDTVCPPSTQFAAYNKITSPKDLLIYPDFGHEDLPGASDSVFDFLADL